MTAMSSTSSPSALRAGIIGAGFIAGVHARAIRGARGRVAGVATRRSSSAAAHRLGAERAYSSPEALLADPRIDVVHICSPNETHVPYALAALAAGKHVVCEKPLIGAPGQRQALDHAVASTGLVVAVPFAYRYHPLVVEARSRIAAGELGRIVSVTGQYLQEWRLASAQDGWWTDPALTGPSRAFADIGSHLADLVEFVSGERIVRVRGVLRTVDDRSPGGRPLSTEDLAIVMIELASGAIGSLTVSQMSWGRKNHLSLDFAGTQARLAFAQERPETLVMADRHGTRLVPRDDADLSPEARRLSTMPAGHPMGFLDAFTALISDAYEATRTHATAELPLVADALRMVRIVDAVLESVAKDAWVMVSPGSAVE
jgi:predicted dehydrogenase